MATAAAVRPTSIMICNAGPEHFGPLQRSYSRALIVPACPEGQQFSSVEIHDHVDMKVYAIDHWAEHSIKTPEPIPCQEIVRDIMATEKMLEKGCFIPAGPEPTKKEIADAKARRRAYLKKCVDAGDAAYSINARIDDIPGEWKRAAEELKMDREWCKMPPAEVTECPACAGEIKPGVAICRHCNAILDKEKAIKFGLIEAPVEQKAKVI